MAFNWEDMANQLEQEALRARTMLVQGERYLRVEDYDPILREHCRAEETCPAERSSGYNE